MKLLFLILLTPLTLMAQPSDVCLKHLLDARPYKSISNSELGSAYIKSKNNKVMLTEIEIRLNCDKLSEEDRKYLYYVSISKMAQDSRKTLSQMYDGR